jgi:dihydroorotate dehydrogenase
VKISPDLELHELRDLCDTVLHHKLDGVIATNSSTDIAGFEAELRARQMDGNSGGISGAPLENKSLETLRLLRRGLGSGFPIISVGGLMSADSVVNRLDEGATLVQLYTGFVYRGPALLDEIHRRLSPTPRR